MEYLYFSNKNCKEDLDLNDKIYNLLTQGENKLTDYNNAINFVINMDQNKLVANYTEMYQINAKNLFCVLRYMTQDSLLGGLLVKKKSTDFIFGYDDQTLSILREGDFIDGSDPSVQTHVSINDVYYNRTLIDKVTQEIFTGNRHPDKVKTARSINGGVYLNNVIPYYNGTNITYGNLNPYPENFRLKGSDGLQFGKSLSSKSKPNVFDSKKIQDVQYKYVGKASYGKINSLKYKLDEGAMKVDYKDNMVKKFYYDGVFNISNTFKLPLASSSGYFSNLDEDTYGKVKIDGKSPSEMSGGINNFYAIEPISGFAVDSQRNEILAIDVHEKYLSFPDLDDTSGFIPLMNVESKETIDEEIFIKKYGFVNSYSLMSFLFRVIFYPLAGVFLLLSAAFFFLLRRQNSINSSYSNLSESFKNESERLIDNALEHGKVNEKYEESKGAQDSTRMEGIDDESSP